MRYFAQTFILLFSFIALPACAEEESNSMPGANADGIPYAVDQSLSWVERRDKHMAACLDARSEKFCAEPLKYNYQAGDEFQDCIWCPVMVVIPPGSFVMGSHEGEEGRLPYEGPQHEVTFSQPFAIGKYEVTMNEWRTCVLAEKCNVGRKFDRRWQANDEPLMMVDWINMNEYVAELERITVRKYTLPSEAQWEYSARAGTTTRFWWGDDASKEWANYSWERLILTKETVNSNRSAKDPEVFEVGSFPINPFGLHDTAGSVLEQILDCKNESFIGAPSDGSAWLEGDCAYRVVKGGTRVIDERRMRSAARSFMAVDTRSADNFTGMRVATNLPR